jgi:phosphate transport system substrate-binding protein
MRFDLRGGGSTVGMERVAAGQVDLGASTLAVTSPPTTTAATASAELMRVPIGLDGLAIIVHPSNVITDLGLSQLRDLFSGDIFDWAELGGESGEVLLISREDGSGSRALFEERVMGDEPVSLTAVVMPTSADMVDYVAQHPFAIGYVSRAYVLDWLPGGSPGGRPPTATDQSPSAGAFLARRAVRVVSVDQQLPTLENIRNQRYFLIQPLFLLSRGQPQGNAQAFIDFVLGPAGQAIVGRFHSRVR